MKKILGLFVFFTVLGVTLHFSPIVQAAHGQIASDVNCLAGDDYNKFPFGLLCRRDNNSTGAMTMYTSQNSGILQGSTNSIDFTAGFIPQGPARTSPGGAPTSVRLWVTIDMNDSVFNGFPITDGGDTSRGCPGTSVNDPIVFNHQDDAGIAQGRPNASPAAWIGGPPNGDGYENCGTQGRMIFWDMGGNFSANTPVERNFRLGINTIGNNGQQICVRANVSVSYGDAAWPTPGRARDASANDGNTASRIAKQSNRYCFTIYNQEPTGDLTTLNCSGFSLNNLRDPDHLTGGQSNKTIVWRIVRQNASGNGVTETISGGTSLQSPGRYFQSVLSPPAAGPSGGFVTSTVYKLQIYDDDSQLWVDGTSNGGSPNPWVQLTTPCDPPQQNCNSLYVKDQDRFDPPGGQQTFYDTRTWITATDSSGRNLTPPFTQLSNGAENTYTLRPTGKFIYVKITREFRGASGTWRPYSDAANGMNTQNSDEIPTWGARNGIGVPLGTITTECFAATCTIDNVTDVGTGGVVQAGRPYRVWYTLTNPPPPNRLTLTSTLGGHALTMNDGGPHNVSAGIAPGTRLSGYYDMGNAPPNDFNVSATPQYFGSFDLGPPCGTPSPVIVYNTFTLTPWPEICTAAAGCDDEDPSAINYRTAVQSDRAVNNVPSEGYAALTPNGGARVNIASYNASKNFAAGSPPPAVNDTLLGVYPARPVNAGDRYCAIVRLSYSTGLVSNAGNIAPGTTSGPTEREACFTVKNKPYFKVLGSGVSAGGNFQSTGVCSGGGVIGGYYRDDSTDPYFDYGQGAGTDLYALATGEIKGFASAQSNAFKSPVELTFANSGLGASDVQNRQSDPNLGGKFAVDNCLTDVSEPSDLTFTQTFNGNTRIPGRTIGLGQNRSIFVNGDAYIDNSITYVDNGNWDYEKVPSFVLKATGNIYIDSSVGTLDGTYIAAATGPNTNGQIYTCAKLNPPNTFELVPKPDRLSQCNRQLTVHGSFVARKVNLMRTYGSIRDEKPSYGVPGQPIGGRVGVTSPLVWSHAGKPAGNNECVLINEPSEPAEGVAPTHHGWNDNWLCLDPADEARVDLDWTHGGADPYPGPATPNCDNFIEATAELDPYTWTDNVLCTNAATVRLTIAQFGNPAGPNEVCTQMYEPWDSDGTNFWQLNGSKKAYACISTDLPSGGRTPDTLPEPRDPLVCSNSGGGATYTPRGGRLNTCAAEVFEFSPEFYLGQPATGDNEDEPIRFDALTSLPPVL